MKPSFTIKEALSFGWTQLKKNFWFLVVFTLATVIAQIVLGPQKDEPVWDIVAQVIAVILNTFSVYVFTRIGLKALKGEGFSWRDVSDVDWKLFSAFFLATVISTVIYALGFLLLIIPGIIAGVRLNFFGYAVVDEKLSAIDSLKRSWALTRGRFWQIFLFGIVVVLVNIAGFIALGVGILVTAPLTLLAMTFVYDRLKSASVEVLPVAQE